MRTAITFPILSFALFGTSFAHAQTASRSDNLLPTAGRVSTSGSDLTSMSVAGASDPALEARVKQLETELAASKQGPSEKSSLWDWTRYVQVQGYIQPQFIWQFFNAAASPNTTNGVLPPGIGANDTIAKSNGDTTNPDFFRLRRARLMAVATPTRFARVVIEIEPLPKGGTIPGSGTVARWVEATAIARFNEDSRMEFGVGQFKIPFGFEILQSDPDRPFIERSWAEQNLFPAEFDTGAHASLYAFKEKLQVRAAVLNGVTIAEKDFAIQPDFNRGKDGTLRANYNFGAADIGASGYLGSGQRVDGAQLRFKQYQRWAANVELALHHVFARRLGATKAFAEGTLASNMDRGLNYTNALPDIPADIKANVVNKQELGFFVRAEQDVSRWVTLGVRYDYYSPDISLVNNQRHTVAGVAVLHITKGLQFMAEYNSALDRVHTHATDVVHTKTIDTLSGVMQGRF